MCFKAFFLHIFLIFYHPRCIAHGLDIVPNILGRLFWRICRTFRVQDVKQIFHQQKNVFNLKTYFLWCLACTSEQAKCILILIRKLFALWYLEFTGLEQWQRISIPNHVIQDKKREKSHPWELSVNQKLSKMTWRSSSPFHVSHELM